MEIYPLNGKNGKTAGKRLNRAADKQAEQKLRGIIIKQKYINKKRLKKNQKEKTVLIVSSIFNRKKVIN